MASAAAEGRDIRLVLQITVDGLRADLLERYRAGFGNGGFNDSSTYLLAGQDDRPYEADLKGYGRVFPHPFGLPDGELFYTRILVSPVGDQPTVGEGNQSAVGPGTEQSSPLQIR